jgi:plastocyanin
VLAACALIAAGASGCGDDEEEPATSTTTAAAEPAATDRVEITDFKYDPEMVAVDARTKLTWTNRDRAAHTATADDGSFDTGTLNLDDKGAVTLDEPGTYAYYCRFHPFMKATVEVR